MVRIEIVDHDTIDVAFSIVQMIWLNMGSKILKLYREIAILHLTVQQFEDLSVLRIGAVNFSSHYYRSKRG